MRVIYCYTTKPENRSAESITKYAPLAEWHSTPNIFDYPNIVASFWTGKEDLVLLEGDTEITAEVLPSFENCSNYWCSYSYMVNPPPNEYKWSAGTGCTLYSANAQQIVSVDEIWGDDPAWNHCPYCDGSGCWNYIDSRIARALRSHGINVHVHGMVKHHHDYSGLYCKTAFDELRTQQAMNNQYQSHFNQADELAGPYWNVKL